MATGPGAVVEPTSFMSDFLQKSGGYAVLDGGLDTELERYGANLNDPLWSAKCLLTSFTEHRPARKRIVSYVGKWHEAGASLVGGCCRTTPITIRVRGIILGPPKQCL